MADIQRDVNSGLLASLLSVSPSAKRLFRSAGFRSVQDILSAKPSQLARDLRLDASKVVEYLDEIKQNLGVSSLPYNMIETSESRLAHQRRSNSVLEMHSAMELYQESETHTSHIITFCRDVDDILGGGIPVGELTEVCGAPGAGKTQFCTQIALDCIIPPEFGGLGGEVIYVDSEGSFTLDRARDIGEAVKKYLKGIQQNSTRHDVELAREQRKALDSITSVNELLSKIHYCRVHDAVEQVACVRSLPSFLADHPKVRLVIVDSVAFHFRHGFEDMSARTRLLMAHAQALNALASTHKLAVLVSNQMTTKVQGNGSNESMLVPALGESWSHAVANRLVLEISGEVHDCSKLLPRVFRSDQRFVDAYRQMAIRTATLIKSSSRKHQQAKFVILHQGVRTVPKAVPEVSS